MTGATTAASGAAATAVARLETDQEGAQRVADAVAAALPADDIAVSLSDGGGGRWSVAIHFRGEPDRQATRALVTAAVGGEAAAALRFERLAERDWVAASLQALRPVAVGRFVVHGAHDRAAIPVNRIGIEIEAALAFGTGHHGTTRGCLAMLDRLGKAMRNSRPAPFSGKPGQVGKPLLRILDVGTGSGVLAIAAARSLRQRVLATDIDAGAVRIARANARLNRVGPMVAVVEADGIAHARVRLHGPFDLVFANILLGPLQRIASPLRKLLAPGARIVLSGVLATQANAALAAYRPLALERRVARDGWTTLVLVRRRRPPGAVAPRGAGL